MPQGPLRLFLVDLFHEDWFTILSRSHNILTLVIEANKSMPQIIGLLNNRNSTTVYLLDNSLALFGLLVL